MRCMQATSSDVELLCECTQKTVLKLQQSTAWRVSFHLLHRILEAKTRLIRLAFSLMKLHRKTIKYYFSSWCFSWTSAIPTTTSTNLEQTGEERGANSVTVGRCGIALNVRKMCRGFLHCNLFRRFSSLCSESDVNMYSNYSSVFICQSRILRSHPAIFTVELEAIFYQAGLFFAKF
jgi:hypothetical protein